MHVALTEILQCPACASGLVLLADRQEESRAIEGALGCPSCGARYPVRDGVADLRPAGPDAPGPGAEREAAAGPARAAPEEPARAAPEGSAQAAPDGSTQAAPDGSAQPPDGPEDAVRLAALLGLMDARGVVVLIGGQARHAAGIAALVPGVEPATVRAEEGPDARPAAASRRASPLLCGARLPFADRRVAGVALQADAHVPLAEAVRVLAPGRRLVLERDRGAGAAALEALGCVVVASGDGVVVAERTGEPEPPRLYQLG